MINNRSLRFSYSKLVKLTPTLRRLSNMLARGTCQMLKGKFTIEFIHDRLVIVLEQMNAISLRDL